jgi:hypothetical protein
MTNAPMPVAHDDRERDRVLTDIGTKPGVAALKTNDELMGQIVARHGVGRVAAQRDVDTLMAGRKLAM